MTSSETLTLEPTILVIFGITGDLAKRYLFPALYHLTKNGTLNDSTEVVGITRGSMDIDELMSTVELCADEPGGVCDPNVISKLRQRLKIKQMDVTDPEAYDQLLVELNEIEDKHNTHMNRLYYLSVPPKAAQPIIQLLGQHGLNKSCSHGVAKTRLLAEKPFGYDLASALEQNASTDKSFTEEQIFRIDHYLAKETVQNILAFRFNNPIFEPLWNGQYVDYIEVIANEKLGIENRVDFYEQTGALRDLLQSHLLQILALIIMEQPEALESEEIHSKKHSIMKRLIAVPDNAINENAVRGQYQNYRSEVSNPDSQVETYAAIRLYADSNRWRQVPLIVRTGKALEEKLSCVNIVFRPTDETPHHNVLTFRIQPNEGIKLNLRIKKPGFDDQVEPADLNLDYGSKFDKADTPTAYQRVLVDAIRGDHTLFATAEEIVEAWRVVEPVRAAWQNNQEALQLYAEGSTGPDINRLYPDKL